MESYLPISHISVFCNLWFKITPLQSGTPSIGALLALRNWRFKSSKLFVTWCYNCRGCVLELFLSLKHLIQWIISSKESGTSWQSFDNWGAVATFKVCAKPCSSIMPNDSSKFNMSLVLGLGIDWENMVWKCPQIGGIQENSKKNQEAGGVQRGLDFSASTKDGKFPWPHGNHWIWKFRIFIIELLAKNYSKTGEFKTHYPALRFSPFLQSFLWEIACLQFHWVL